MGSSDGSGGAALFLLFIGLALSLGVFLVLRAVVLWYWRVNRIVALLEVIAVREARMLDATRWLVYRAAAKDARNGVPMHAPVPRYSGEAPFASADFKEAWNTTTSEPHATRGELPASPAPAPDPA